MQDANSPVRGFGLASLPRSILHLASGKETVMRTTENYHFEVGTLKCMAINDCIGTLPGQCTVKDVPADRLNQAFLERRMSLTETVIDYNCLYIQTDRLRILVDAGLGRGGPLQDKGALDRLDAEGKLPMPRSALPTMEGDLLDRLQAEGLTPADIDRVIITHFDGDHVGGLTSGGQVVFPKADYILLKDAWDFWSDAALVSKWPAMFTAFGRRTLPLIQDRLTIVEAGVEFLPGFQLIPAPGHRPGHTAVAITSSGEHLIHLADTVGHPILMEYPAWHGFADSNHDQAAKDRVHLLSRAVAQQALIFGSHLPFPAVGHVIPQGEGWRWQPLTEASK
jgi:glyoxylase-like metal-dependent hydrolase (beta-lactamase superfamily II)